MTDRPADDPAIEAIVEQLRSIEESLRDVAYDRLREAAEAGETKVPALQRRLEQARRGVAKAVQALDPRESLS